MILLSNINLFFFFLSSTLSLFLSIYRRTLTSKASVHYFPDSTLSLFSPSLIHSLSFFFFVFCLSILQYSAFLEQKVSSRDHALWPGVCTSHTLSEGYQTLNAAIVYFYVFYLSMTTSFDCFPNLEKIVDPSWSHYF